MTELPQRFLTKIEVSDGCWLWTAYTNKDGYACTKWQGKSALTHRVIYELAFGPVPEGLTLDHLCRRRNCVNPNHLEAVKHSVNLARGDGFDVGNAQRSRTHCPSGHPYDEANTYLHRGKRSCKACALLRVAKLRKAAHG